MRKIKKIRSILTLLLLGLGTILQAQNLPDPMSPPRLVNDFAGLLNQQEWTQLEGKLRNYHDTTTTQIYVVIVDDLLGYDIADYAIRIGEKWGVGQKGKDNGAIILVKPPKGNERGEAFIGTGYGLEDVIPDALAKRVMERELIPAFREDAYYKGLDDAITVMMGLASGKFSADQYDGDEDIALFGIAFLLFMIILALILGGKKKKGRTMSSGFPTGVVLGTMMGSKGGRSSGSSGFSNFSSGRGSFGGFSGGGGGSFGGGGARGSW